MEESNLPANRKIKPMIDATNRRQFLGITAAAGLSRGLASEAVRAEAAASGADDGKAASRSQGLHLLLDRAGRLCGRESRQPQTLYAQGRGTLEGPTHAIDLAAGDCGGQIVLDSSTKPPGGRHGARPGLAHGTGEVTRREVLEGHAVQQHSLPARPRALGGRAVTRVDPARRR